MAERLVNCSFLTRGKDRTISQATIVVPTGLSTWHRRLHSACRVWAIDSSRIVSFAMPVDPERSTWAIYDITDDWQQVVRSFPTRDAAEMWMLHNGE